MNKNFIFSAFIFAIFTGCATYGYMGYYQVQELNSSNVDIQTMKFQDSTLLITYDFWNQSGNTKSLIYNKSDSIVYIDLSLSHLIINKIAHPLFDNTIEHTNYSITNSPSSYIYNPYRVQSNSSGYTKIPSQTLIIPPHSAKFLPGYSISQLYSNPCDNNVIDSFSYTFTQENSPCIFTSLLYYKIGYKNQLIPIKNDFWVSKIYDLVSYRFQKSTNTDECGRNTNTYHYYSLWIAPNRFYIRR